MANVGIKFAVSFVILSYILPLVFLLTGGLLGLTGYYVSEGSMPVVLTVADVLMSFTFGLCVMSRYAMKAVKGLGKSIEEQLQGHPIPFVRVRTGG